MAETLKLQTLTCPSCTRQISSFNPFSSTVKCPSCGTLIKNPMVDTKDTPAPERIIPFTTTQDDFEAAIVNALVNTDYVDRHVFEGINPDNIFQQYLPMYLFEGTYMSSWSCESAYKDQKVEISGGGIFDDNKEISTKEVKKWRPQNGTATGNFAFLCLANEGDKAVPDELREFTKLFPYNVMCSKEFRPELLSLSENQLGIAKNADATLIWQKHGKEMVDRTAENAALNQIGNQEIRNFRASSSFTLSTKGVYVLAPFWFVYYTFKNQKYYFLMDGLGENTSFTYPVDQEDVAFTESKEKVKTIVKWLWPLAFVVMYFAGFVPGLVSLVVWFIAKLIVNKVMNNQIASNLANTRQLRQKGASRL